MRADSNARPEHCDAEATMQELGLRAVLTEPTVWAQFSDGCKLSGRHDGAWLPCLLRSTPPLRVPLLPSTAGPGAPVCICCDATMGWRAIQLACTPNIIFTSCVKLQRHSTPCQRVLPLLKRLIRSARADSFTAVLPGQTAWPWKLRPHRRFQAGDEQCHFNTQVLPAACLLHNSDARPSQ